MADGESRAELIAAGLHFPTSLAFDDDGILYVAESGLPFGGAPPGRRVWRLREGGDRSLVADGLQPPVNGLAWHDGSLLASEAGPPGRLTRLAADGARSTLVGGLPGPGNYHTNMVAAGPDGWLYFSQGAMTNSGIIGLDSYDLGWLGRLPHGHDVPGYDVTLAGVNAETADPLAGDPDATAVTGAFSPFGTPTAAGQRVAGQTPCTAAVLRCRPDGSGLETVAWGLRNAFGIGFLGDGRLLAVDQGADDRGSRPVGNAPDLLFEVRPQAWYGWPDFIDGVPVTDRQFRPERGPAPTFLLTSHERLPAPERALLRFPPHTAATKFGVAPSAWNACAGRPLHRVVRRRASDDGARRAENRAVPEPHRSCDLDHGAGPHRPADPPDRRRLPPGGRSAVRGGLRMVRDDSAGCRGQGRVGHGLADQDRRLSSRGRCPVRW